MQVSILLKRIIASVLFQSGVAGKKMDQLYGDGFSPILMYHRVVTADKLIQAGMYVTPETFESHLIFLEKYFNIIPLNSLNVKGGNGNFKNGKPSCVLTFDDGWKDFYDYVFPLLKKNNVPATVFLPTGFVGVNKQFWTDYFTYLLSCRSSSVESKNLDQAIHKHIEFLDGLRGSFEEQLETGIEYLKTYPLSTIEKVLDALSAAWQVDEARAERNFLNWTEIAEMKQSGLVSFGSHTVNHQILTTMDDKVIERELTCSREELLKRNVVDSSFIPFCYPNGNYSEEIVNMARSSGYHLAVTTKKGWNHKDADKFTLKRVAIHEDMSSTTALFASKIAGFI